MKYKIGDTVKIIKKTTGAHCTWQHEMNKYIGKVFTIEYVSSHGNYRWKDGAWWFPPESLSLVNSQLLFSFMGVNNEERNT